MKTVKSATITLLILGGCDQLVGLRDTKDTTDLKGSSTGASSGVLATGGSRFDARWAGGALGVGGTWMLTPGPLTNGGGAGAGIFTESGGVGGQELAPNGGTDFQDPGRPSAADCGVLANGSSGQPELGAGAGGEPSGGAGAVSSRAFPSAGADNGGAGSAAAPFLPKDLSGLALWLDAGVDTGLIETDGGKWVTSWRDLSPFRNDARQTDLSSAPLWGARRANGLPGLAFNGDRDSLKIEYDPSLDFGTNDFVIEVVGYSVNATLLVESQWGYGMFVCKHAVPRPFTGTCLFANFQPVGAELGSITAAGLFGMVSADVVTVSNDLGLNDGILRMYAMVRRGSELRLRVNGAEVGMTQFSSEMDVSCTDSPLWIGGEGSAYQALRGLIAEIVMVQGHTSDAELQHLEAYLNAKYDL